MTQRYEIEPCASPHCDATVTTHYGMKLVDRIAELEAERRTILGMLIDATAQGALVVRDKDSGKETDLVWHGFIGTWEDILPWLVENGLAEGDPVKGVRLIWDDKP